MKVMSEWRRKRTEKILLRNRNYKKLIYNRLIITFALVIVQLALSGFLLFTFYEWSSRLILFLIDFIGLICVLYILNHDEKPSSKLNWIIIILIFPFFGVFAYVIFGEGRPTRKMNKKICASKKENMQVLKRSVSKADEAALQGRSSETCRYLHDFAGYPAYADGDVEYYETGEKMFPKMLEELEKAEKFILAEYFIVAGGKMWTAFRDVIVRKAQQGVQIRLIFDDWGCILQMPPHFDKYMEALHPNIKCLMFNHIIPFFSMRLNNRDHRKFLVIDGKVGFTGGINIADEYINEKSRFGHWKDTGVKLTGNSVNSFTMMFFNLWNAFKQKENLEEFLVEHPVAPADGDSTRPFLIHPYDDSPLDSESVGETVYLDIVNRAKKYVYIFTPYLILDDYMRTAICSAAKRGVDVRIVTPGTPDKKAVFRLTRANYPVLLKAGVKIYEYTPGFIHAKSMVSDDNTAVVGTINLDYRSLYLHFENAVYFTGCHAVADVKKDCEDTFLSSKQIGEADVKRSWLGRILDSLLRVFETTV